LIPNIVFISLRYFILFLLYLFLILVVRAIYRDVRAPSPPAEKRSGKKRTTPELVLLAGTKNVGARYKLGEHVVIGRSEASGIVIDDTYASQEHARIYRSDDSFFVEDLGSTNGTYVNGRRISYPLSLRSGDRIKIGKTVFEFQC